MGGLTGKPGTRAKTSDEAAGKWAEGNEKPAHWGLYATTTATLTKTSLENTSSCYFYYFALIPIRSTSTM